MYSALAALRHQPDSRISRACSSGPCCRRKGKKVFFVTNNSTKSRAQYEKKLNQLGIEAT